MKKIFIIAALAALLPWSLQAQDARQRTTATIVADALAQLPASKVKTFDDVMAELAGTGAEGVVQMADMLVPADKGKNATVEYALSGVTAYVTAAGREELRAGVRRGLAQAVDKCTDNPNKAFLLTQLALCAEAEDAPVFVKYLGDGYLGDWAVKGLISTPGTGEVILGLMKEDKAPRAALAYAASKKGLAEAEPILLAWSNGADAKTAAAVNNALGLCGTAASLKTLGAAAKAVNYAWEETDATASYLVLLNRVAATEQAAQAEAEARKLMKATAKSNVRVGALEALYTAGGKKVLPVMLAALNDADRQYRVAALKLAEPFADDEVYAAVGKVVTAKGENPAKVDIVNWLGAQHAVSQTDAVVAGVASPDKALASASIKAAGRLGGPKALEALVGQLGGDMSAEAEAALLAFNGKVDEGVVAALDGAPAVQVPALNIAARRRMYAASDKVFALLDSEDAAVSAAAYDALAGVTSVKDFDRLCDLAEKASGENEAKLRNALKNSVVSLAPEKQYETVAARLGKSSKRSLYYPVLAQAGDSRSIAEILKGYDGADKESALAALLTVDNAEMIPVLYGIAVKDKNNADAALTRYTDLVVKSEATPVRKYQLYRQALELNPAVPVQNKLVKALAATLTYRSLLLADTYLDNKATASAAAETVKFIAAKNTGAFGGEPVKRALGRAVAEYKSQTTNADAGYAVDEIGGLLAKLPAAAYVPVFDGVKGWSAVALDPAAAAAVKAKELAKIEAAAEATAAGVWSGSGDVVKYAGGENSTLGSDKEYENFELWFEWKGNGALGVRSIPQIALGGENSGALTGNVNGRNTPLKAADNAAGEWNTAYVKVVNDRVTVEVNGVVTADNVIMENTCDRELPAYVEGKILLIGQGQPIEFREMMVRELPSTPRFELSAEEAAEGFEVLFDGTSMHKWTGNTRDYIPVDGTILVSAQYGSGGNLYTIKEYSDFIYRFEFCFLREGVNNGVGLRTPMGVDAAYEGMEIQILDHDAPIYKNLREYQQHGSVYGIIPAKRVKFPALGEWNVEEIRAVGDHITVTVNGEVILDGNIREACQGHNVSEDGSKTNPYTVDHRNHPGLFNTTGHIGFLGHGSGVQFRNIRIKDLSAPAEVKGKKAKRK